MVIIKNIKGQYYVNGIRKSRSDAVKAAKKSPNHHVKVVNGVEYPWSNPRENILSKLRK